jgi:hypothetical protein
MAYIGQDPVIGRYIIVDQISGGFNGTASGFTLAAGGQGVIPGLAQNVLLSLGGVIQQPGTDYTVSGSGITFTTPPLSGTTFFATVLGDVQAVGTPSDGTVLPASIATSGTFVFPNLTTTGTTLIASGNASTPSLAVIGDTNTGLYSPGADQLAISTGGTGRLFVTSTGSVGVGIGSPIALGKVLNIYGGSSEGSSIALEANSGSEFCTIFSGATAADPTALFSKSGFKFAIATAKDATGFSEKMRLDSSGRLGVGTSSPGGAIHVANTGYGIFANSAIAQTPASAGLSIGYNRSGANGEVSLVYGAPAAGYNFEICSFASSTITPRLTIDVSGRVGIGTSTFSYLANKLVIDKGSTANDGITIVSSNTSNACIWFADGTTGSEAYRGGIDYNHSTDKMQIYTGAQGNITIDSAGRLGIGTTSPQHLLDCTSIGRFTGNANSAASGSGIEIGYDSGASSGFIQSFNRATSGYLGTFIDGANVRFQIAGVEAARIDTARRLLVGTSTSVGNATFSTAEFVKNTLPEVVIGRSDAPALSGDGIGRIHFNGNAGGVWETHAAITCQADGACGSGDKPGRLVFSTTADGSASPTERMRIGNNGHVNIGQTASGLDNARSFSFQTTGAGQAVFNHSTANGNGDHWIIFGYNNTQIGSITQNGTTATSYNTSSDYRLKENVIPVPDGIARFKQLKPSRFNFIADPDRTVDGFIAHEAQAVVPECVTGEKDAIDDDGNPIYQGIDQSKLVPLLTAALQEALQKIEDLEGRLTAAGI